MCGGGHIVPCHPQTPLTGAQEGLGSWPPATCRLPGCRATVTGTERGTAVLRAKKATPRPKPAKLGQNQPPGVQKEIQPITVLNSSVFFSKAAFVGFGFWFFFFFWPGFSATAFFLSEAPLLCLRPPACLLLLTQVLTGD